MTERMKMLAAVALAAALILPAGPTLAQDAGETTSPDAGEAPGWRGQDMGPGMGPGMRRRMMADGPPRAGRQGGPGPRMGGHPMMFDMLFAAVDADGSGTISLEEMLAVHERMFARVDRDDDGELSEEEIRRHWGWGPMRRNR